MCEKNECCCEQIKVRKVNPEECSPEQICECHGDVAEHPCCEPAHSCQCGHCAEGNESTPAEA